MSDATLIGATAPDIATFAVAATMVILGAVGVVATRKPVHAALSLVVTLFGIAVLFVAQEAHFLAAVQVIVYAGAIVVLFLFVIMLFGVDQADQPSREPIRGQRPLAALLSVASVGLLIAIAKVSWDAVGAPEQGGPLDGPGSDIDKIADSIFTQYLFSFEATSILLVIAVVGAVVLARSADSEGRPTYEDELPYIPAEELTDDEGADDAEAVEEEVIAANDGASNRDTGGEVGK